MTLNQLASDIHAGFLDKATPSNRHYLPRLLTNKKGTKVLKTICRELETCDAFYFSVAFLTNGGMATLINQFRELERRNIPGKVMVSQYQNFTDPKALRRLLQFTNIDLRIVTEGNMHSKGFLFKHREHYTLIVGSSNLTQEALCSNREWNLAISSAYAGSIVSETFREFEDLFNTATKVTEEWIDKYEQIYIRPSFTPAKRISITPNKMQLAALEGLEALRNNNKHKALLISATGTGKTYLSAFDVKKVNPKKFLFLVHRENIARAAKKTFEKLFGNTKRMGIVTGKEKDLEADYIFSTIQTFSKDDILYSYPKDAFDYIVIDEAHRSGAKTYLKIIDWFTPQFLLGMTATPERTDGFDIYQHFDHNIAYEIRLNDALEEHMLCPFHYYGVTDITVNGEVIDDAAADHAFNRLVCEERVRNIIQTADFYGCDRGRVKGLIFCSRKEEAYELSEKLNEHGLRTLALTGDSSESERESAIQRLEADEGNTLDYLITVDIFNEGIDIPSLNQIIMLRPTESAIIFVQQLGRGLRKTGSKEYLTVIDFIGNYANNYLVPIALFGDTSYNKDTIRKMITAGSDLIPGASTIDFDPISHRRILESLDKANVEALKQLREDYNLLKFKIGHTPKMMDFIAYGSRDPFAYVKRDGSLYSFVSKIEPETPRISADFEKRLNFFSSEICNGKRLEESVILQTMTEKEETSLQEILGNLQKNYAVKSTNASLLSAIRLINGKFHLQKYAGKYASAPYLAVNGETIEKTATFKEMLEDTTFKEYLEDALQYSVVTFRKNYTAEAYKEGFTLYSKYSRKDVCRILNWEQNEESVMYGYSIKYNTCPIFVTYKKSEDISASIKYEDKFLDPTYFHWMTRNGIRLDSKEVQMIRDYRNSGLRILLFVKKSDAESSDFYYMGDMKPDRYTEETIRDNNGKEKPIVNINFKMDVPVSDDIYRYLTEV